MKDEFIERCLLNADCKGCRIKIENRQPLLRTKQEPLAFLTARSSSGAGRMMSGTYRNGHGDGCCDNRGQHKGMT